MTGGCRAVPDTAVNSRLMAREVDMKLLVCYGGNRSSVKALDLAIDHAQKFGAAVYVATVLTERGEDLAGAKAKAESAVKEAVGKVQAAGLKAESQILQQEASKGEMLVHYAKLIGADMVYIGVATKSKVGKLLFGSTAQYLILEGDCPVVSVK